MLEPELFTSFKETSICLDYLMPASDLDTETPYKNDCPIGGTFRSMFEFYYKRQLNCPETFVVPRVGVYVNQSTYDELQHIKDCIDNTYSLALPTKDLNPNTIVQLGHIETRHKQILYNILDMFNVPE